MRASGLGLMLGSMAGRGRADRAGVHPGRQAAAMHCRPGLRPAALAAAVSHPAPPLRATLIRPLPGLPTCRCRLSEQNPAIHRLLDQPALAANELAMRLYFFFSAQDRPLLEPSDLTAAAAPAAEDESAAGGGGSEDGGSEGHAAPAVAAGCTAEAVPAELMEQLARYRGMACLSYDFDTGWLRLLWLPLRLPLPAAVGALFNA